MSVVFQCHEMIDHGYVFFIYDNLARYLQKTNIDVTYRV